MVSVPCICCGCTIVEDPFGRPDGSDITTGSPGGWTKQAGTSSISGGKLLLAANTLVTCDVDDGGTNVEVWARIIFTAANDGDQARVLVKHGDSNNYWYAQITIGFGGSLKLFERSGGTDTQRSTALLNTSAGDGYSLVVCYGSGHVSAIEQTTSTIAAYTTATTATGTPRAGIATGSVTSGISISNFNYSRGFRDDDGRRTCPKCLEGNCVGTCANGSLPSAFQVILSGFTGSACCLSFNATYILDTFQSGCAYSYTFPNTTCANISGQPVTLKLSLNSETITLELRQPNSGFTPGFSYTWFFGTSFHLVDCSAIDISTNNATNAGFCNPTPKATARVIAIP